MPQLECAAAGPRCHDLAVARRAEGHVPHPAALRLGPRGRRVEPAQQLAHDDPHLEEGEARPQAALDPAAERDPRVGVGRLAQEALGTESGRLTPVIGGELEERHRRHHRRARGQPVPGHLHRRHQVPRHLEHDRPHPQRLLDHRVEVGVVPGVERLAQASHRLGVAHQPLERPGQAGRGRLVPGQQQGDQLVAERAVVQAVAVLVPRLDQHREHVIAAAARARRRAISS